MEPETKAIYEPPQKLLRFLLVHLVSLLMSGVGLCFELDQ